MSVLVLMKAALIFSLVTEARNAYSNIRLSDWFNRPAVLEEGDNFDDLSRGLATQPERLEDDFFDSEVLKESKVIE